jgi:hypothetical protein
MTERPILFSGPLVRAILAGTKIETRRLVTKSTSSMVDETRAAWDGLRWDEATVNRLTSGVAQGLLVPGPGGFHGVAARAIAGDILRVRESWRTCATLGHVKPSELPEDAPILYTADKHARGETGEWGKGRPSIFLPKWASRIRLHVTEVRAQRLQWITDDDAIAEGIEMVMESFAAGMPSGHYRSEFALLWDRINGKRPGASWSANPWVWVLKFERLR